MSKKKPSSPSRWVRFTARFDYTWPSRAVTAYPVGYEGRVPGEVADAAVPGKAEEIPAPESGLSPLDKPENSQ